MPAENVKVHKIPLKTLVEISSPDELQDGVRLFVIAQRDNFPSKEPLYVLGTDANVSDEFSKLDKLIDAEFRASCGTDAENYKTYCRFRDLAKGLVFGVPEGDLTVVRAA